MQTNVVSDAMIPSDLSSPLRAHERNNVRRKRFQEGSLQARSHGKRKMWVVLYRERGARKYHTLGLFSKMTKSEAQGKQAEFMKEVNERQSTAPDPDITFWGFSRRNCVTVSPTQVETLNGVYQRGSYSSSSVAGVWGREARSFGTSKAAGVSLVPCRDVFEEHRFASALGSAGDFQARVDGRLYPS